jgi:replicative DNA helicase
MDSTYLASIIDIANPCYFKNDDVKVIFEIITEFYKKRETVPTTTEIKAYLVTPERINSFKNVISSFKNIDNSYNKDELYENSERFFKERAVYKALTDTITEYSNNKCVNSSEIFQTFETACNISLVDDLGHDYFNQIDSHCNDLNKEFKTIGSGYKWLDKMLDGGFLAEGRSLYVFSGVTNSGKSIILGNLAANICAQGKTAVVISLEMSETIYAKRLSAQMSGIPIYKLKDETNQLKDYVSNYKKQNNSAKLFIKEFPPKSVTTNHIRAYIQRLINKKHIKPDVLIMDYVNLLQPSIITGNSYTDIKTVTEQLRALSYIFKCPVITATQLHRCLTLDTNVIRDKKEVAIKDIKIGDIIEGNNRKARVTHIYPTTKQKIYKIVTKSGKTIKCSRNHIFPTKTGDKCINSGLNIGDILYVQRNCC